MGLLRCIIVALSQNYSKIVSLHMEQGLNQQITNQNLNLLEQQLNRLMATTMASHKKIEELCDIFEQGREAISDANNDNQQTDFLAILYIDGGLSFDYDPLSAAAEFKRRDLVLFIINDKTPNFQAGDNLHILAENTGGAYVYVRNAPVIFEKVVTEVVSEQNSIRQAFRHPQVNLFQRNRMVNTTANDNQNYDGVGDMQFELLFE